MEHVTQQAGNRCVLKHVRNSLCLKMILSNKFHCSQKLEKFCSRNSMTTQTKNQPRADSYIPPSNFKKFFLDKMAQNGDFSYFFLQNGEN